MAKTTPKTTPGDTQSDDIARYVEEGFDLGCPQVNRPGKAAMPYSHWWVHRHNLSPVQGDPRRI